jgi:hypothetical protein
MSLTSGVSTPQRDRNSAVTWAGSSAKRAIMRSIMRGATPETKSGARVKRGKALTAMAPAHGRGRLASAQAKPMEWPTTMAPGTLGWWGGAE